MITVVTPTYNSEEYLEDCIKGIMSQTYRNFEHIIVDGGSQDGTLSIIKKYEGKYPMRWISEPDNGMYDAISKGFKMAKGDIFCWINSDDMYLPWTFEAINKVMYKVVNGTKVQWCVGVGSRYTSDGINYIVDKGIKTYPREFIRRGWHNGQKLGCLQQESSFWTRELYESVGGIDTQYKLAGDYHLWRKFAEKERLYSLNTLISGFRIHEGQKSSDKIEYFREEGKMNSVEMILAKFKIFKIIDRFCAMRQKDLIIKVQDI
jgi:glycosyltransferase, family 2